MAYSQNLDVWGSDDEKQPGANQCQPEQGYHYPISSRNKNRHAPPHYSYNDGIAKVATFNQRRGQGRGYSNNIILNSSHEFNQRGREFGKAYININQSYNHRGRGRGLANTHLNNRYYPNGGKVSKRGNGSSGRRKRGKGRGSRKGRGRGKNSDRGRGQQRYVYEPNYVYAQSPRTSFDNMPPQCVRRAPPLPAKPLLLFESLLKEWNLGKYVDKFEEEGWDEPELWRDLSEDELKTMGLRGGHINKFNNKYKEWREKQKNAYENAAKQHPMIPIGNGYNDGYNHSQIKDQIVQKVDIESTFNEFAKEYGWDKTKRQMFSPQKWVFAGSKDFLTAKYLDFVQRNILGTNTAKRMPTGIYNDLCDYIMAQIKSPFQQIDPPKVQQIHPEKTSKLQNTFVDGQNVWLLIFVFDIDLKWDGYLKYNYAINFCVGLWSKTDESIRKLIEGQNDDADEGDVVSGQINKLNEKARSANEQKAVEYKKKGNDFYAKKLFKEAIVYYKKAQLLDDKEAAYVLNESAALFMMEQWDETTKCCLMAIEIAQKYSKDPKWCFKAYRRMGSVEEKKGNLLTAIQHYKNALKQMNNNALNDKVKKMMIGIYPCEYDTTSSSESEW